MKNYGLNLQKEKLEISDSDWIFGSDSKDDLGEIPLERRKEYLPEGEIQRTSKEDMQDCATRSPINHLEAKFTYFYRTTMSSENKKWLESRGYIEDGKVTFSDAFIAILSGTTRQGNSLKAPLETIRKRGLIPKYMLPLKDDMTFDDYHNKERITPRLIGLGEDFARRFTINYERVFDKDFKKLAGKDLIGVAGYAWGRPVKGVYKRTDKQINHAFLMVQPEYEIFDNYLDKDKDFIKKLAPDYKFLEYGYRVFISAENPNPKSFNVLENLIEMLKDTLQRIIDKPIEEGVKKDILQETKNKLEVIKDNMDKTKTLQQQLLDLTKANLGRDITPEDNIPDEVACAEVVSALIKKLAPDFPIIPHTANLYRRLQSEPSFEATLDLEPGNIIISPTGFGNYRVRGHVGIILEKNRIASNDSATGLLEDNYSLANWVNYFRVRGALPIFIFKMKATDVIMGSMENEKKFRAFSSSIDSNKLSLTVQAALGAIASLLVIIFGDKLPFNETEITEIVGQIGLVTSQILILVGLFRKGTVGIGKALDK